MDWASVLSSSLSAMLGPFAAIYALAAIGLNLHFGYTGLLNFGHVAFMLVGAYGVGVAVYTYQLSMWWGILISVVAAVVLALILGIPTLRLRGDYLAIATIASGEILRYFFNSAYLEPVTQGSYGFKGANREFQALNPFSERNYTFGPFHFTSDNLWVMVVTWSLVALGCLLVFLLIRSPWGRVLRSVREDELAARSLGKNVFSFKMQSLVLGGVFGALAGAMWTLDTGSQFPSNFIPEVTFYLWVAMILGGAGRILGPVIGSMIFWFLFSFIEGVTRAAIPALNPGATRIAIVGLVLILLMAFRPAGILGNKEEMRLEVR